MHESLPLFILVFVLSTEVTRFLWGVVKTRRVSRPQMGPELKGVSEQNGTKVQVPAQPYTPDGLLGDPLMGTCLDTTDTSWGREHAQRTKSGCAQQRLMITEAVESERCLVFPSPLPPLPSLSIFFQKLFTHVFHCMCMSALCTYIHTCTSACSACRGLKVLGLLEQKLL